MVAAAPRVIETAPWPVILRDLRVQRLRFRVVPQQSFAFQAWPGSMLRGAISGALERLSVTDPAFAAAHAVLSPAADGAQQGDSVVSSVLVEWDPILAGWREAGEDWGFDVLLIGGAMAIARPLVGAVADAAEFGLGKGRIKHAISSIAFVPPSGDGTPCAQHLASLPASGRLALRFVTPTCVGRSSKEPPTFAQLLVAADNRARLLSRHHLGVEPPPLSPERLAAAEAVRMDVRGLEWVALSRAASKRGRKVSLGGHVGRVVIEGAITPFAAELASAFALHLGRFVSIGHGRVVLDAGR